MYYFNIPLSFDLVKNFIFYKLKLKNFIYTKNGSKTDKFMKHWQSFQNVEKLYSVSQIEPVSINYFNDDLINKIKNTCKIEKNLTVLPHPILKI